MDFLEQTKNLLYRVATFNIAGNYPWGGIAVSTCAFPLIFVGRMLYIFSADAFYNLFILLILTFLGSVQFVLESLPSDRRNTIVINRLLGVLIGYYYVPIQLKFIIITLCLFHALRTLIPQIILSQWNIDAEAHPGLIGIFGLDILTGLSTNVCMHLLRLFLN